MVIVSPFQVRGGHHGACLVNVELRLVPISDWKLKSLIWLKGCVNIAFGVSVLEESEDPSLYLKAVLYASSKKSVMIHTI